MILAFDTYYFDNKAKTVCICFQNWEDEKPYKIYSEIIANNIEYEAGAFYKRELPCIIHLLQQIDDIEISTIIVDSFVYLDDKGKLGLGGYLYEKLQKKIPIIGVAKTNFLTLEKNKIELFRGESRKPLFITSVGIDILIASEYIKKMNGEFRFPTLLKLLDRLTKTLI